MSDEQPDFDHSVQGVLTSPVRLAALHAAVADLGTADDDFKDIVQIVGSIFAAPIVLLTLLDEEQQWFKASLGTTETSAPSLESFCAHVIADPSGGALIIRDTLLDRRFIRHARVVGAPYIRSYIGVPLVNDGQPIGTIGIFGLKPLDDVTSAQIDQLQGLARLAMSLLLIKDDARKRALKEAVLSRDEQRHAMALEAANVGSWLWDIRSGIVSGNAAMARMFQMKPGNILHAKDIFLAINNDDRGPALAKLRAAIAEDGEYHGIFRIGDTGRWLMGRGRVHERDAQGRPRLFLGINIDVTEEQSSTQRTKLLLRELNHRVKNTLAMLQSLARQTLRTTSDPQQFMTAFAGRLQAISEAHGLLSDHEWGEIHLSALLLKQLTPHVRDYEKQVEIHKDEILLGPDQAVGLGLVLHELATNAAKYGSLSARNGKVVITARRVVEDERKVLNLTWTELGGPAAEPPTRRGFGSILIERSLDKVMGSSVKLEYLPAGLTAIVNMPL